MHENINSNMCRSLNTSMKISTIEGRNLYTVAYIYVAFMQTRRESCSEEGEQRLTVKIGYLLSQPNCI